MAFPSAGIMTTAEPIAVGYAIPPLTINSVDPARMKTMAAILRDPYPLHWDRKINELIGLGNRVVNQGPLNVGYVANMLMAWAGPDSIKRLTLSFGNPVFDGDCVVAHGVVTALDTSGTDAFATCDIWLERAGEHVVTGVAVVRLNSHLLLSVADNPNHLPT